MNDNIVTVARVTIRTAEKFSRIEKEYPALLLLARAVVRQDEEIRQLKDMAQIIGECDSKKINAQIDDINALKDRLTALREIYRWRKYEAEEPADGELVVARIMLYGGLVPRFMVLNYDAGVKVFVAPDGTGYSVTYWRPIDLPEEESK
ncbi:hypothetical protein [Cloacibacillus evryensis]|uniref:hypothetical protein n=1 Tax=Cloacibacillus evryensis TaxID=508460 RepID=UPI0004BCCE08|nr:hypothetical protein [Cloacibacillus evryensis]